MTVNEILEQVIANTGRTEYTQATIEPLIRATLKDMTIHYPFLRTNEEISISSRETALSGLEQDLVKALFLIDDNEEEVEQAPDMKSLERDTNESRPDSWFVFNRVLYVNPPPDEAYTFTLWYSYAHPSDLSPVALDSRFFECVVLGTSMRVFRAKQLHDDAKEYLPLYSFEKRELAGKLIEKEAKFVKYNDL